MHTMKRLTSRLYGEIKKYFLIKPGQTALPKRVPLHAGLPVSKSEKEHREYEDYLNYYLQATRWK